MTDDASKFFDYSKSPLSPYQQARAEALRTAAGVLSSSSGFVIAATKTPPKSIDSLLEVSDWILGGDRPGLPFGLVPGDLQGVGVKIEPDNLPALFEALGRISEDCGHPDCPIHAPTREAKDLNPEDALSSWDGPVDFGNTDQTGMAEASDFEGGKVDAENEKKDNPFPSPEQVELAKETPGVTGVSRELPDPANREVGERFVVDNVVFQVTRDFPLGPKYWIES